MPRSLVARTWPRLLGRSEQRPDKYSRDDDTPTLAPLVERNHADHQIRIHNDHSKGCARSALMGVIVSRDFVIWG